MNRLTVAAALFLLFAAQNASARTTICHVPPDNPGNAHTITVSDNAVPSHLAHGDCEGACPCQVATCGDGTCDASIGESCASCSQDCGPCSFCGDASCDASTGESCESCPQDCRPCVFCGDGTCNAGESDADCPQDCGCAAPGESCEFGDPAPFGCFCDELCVENGDCCADACDVCGQC
jgi:hypothetical protein